MEEPIRVSAKTVEDAITEATIELGTSRDNLEYTVIEKGSSGFFGIGGKRAVIEAKKKISDEDLMKEILGSEEKPKKKRGKDYKKEFKKEKKEFKEEQKEYKKEVKQELSREEKKQELSQEEKTAEAVSDVPQEETEKETAPKAPRVPADPEEAMRRAEQFLTGVFKTMDMEVEMNSSFEEETLTVDLAGENMGILIGKRGQTLDSLQYLTSLVVNKGKASYVRVKLDTEDYRSRRKATLENLARNIAFKVKKTRRPVFLEPMNPYERRIIHSALQNDPYVTTHSEGEEPCRKVVVTLRKK